MSPRVGRRQRSIGVARARKRFGLTQVVLDAWIGRYANSGGVVRGCGSEMPQSIMCFGTQRQGDLRGRARGKVAIEHGHGVRKQSAVECHPSSPQRHIRRARIESNGIVEVRQRGGPVAVLAMKLTTLEVQLGIDRIAAYRAREFIDLFINQTMGRRVRCRQCDHQEEPRDHGLAINSRSKLMSELVASDW